MASHQELELAISQRLDVELKKYRCELTRCLLG
jgi:hypothetical protein